MNIIKQEKYELFTPQEIETIKQFKELEVKFNEIRKEKRQVLIDYLKSNNQKSVITDDLKIVLKDSYTRHTFDSKKFKEDSPEIYQKYLKESFVDESVAIEVIYD